MRNNMTCAWTTWPDTNHVPVLNAMDDCMRCADDSSCRVLEDYTQRLQEGTEALQPILDVAVAALAGASDTRSRSSSAGEFAAVVFNPLGYNRSQLVRVTFPRVNNSQGWPLLPTILGPDKRPVPAQVEIDYSFVIKELDYMLGQTLNMSWSFAL